MTQALFDAGTVLHTGVINNSQSFSPIQLNPRMLATCAWAINIIAPAVASASFSLEVASTSAGAYTAIQTVAWPAGTTGTKVVPLGVQGQMAAARNTSAAWVRVSVTCTGVFSATSWLTKASDGAPGLGSRSYTLDALNVL